MTGPNAPLHEMRQQMCVSTPINKVTSAGLRGRLPQITGPLMIGAFGVGALGADIAWHALSSTRGTGCAQRFVDLATAALDSDFPVRAHEAGASEGRAPRRVVHAEVGEGFGRPSLVSIDIVVASSDALSEHKAVACALDAITRATWNSPEMAPVNMHARVLPAHGEAGDLEASGVQTDTAADMSALGFTDEIACPDELYGRYGTSEYGPVWRP